MLVEEVMDRMQRTYKDHLGNERVVDTGAREDSRAVVKEVIGTTAVSFITQ
jgi:hypothetical protein